MFTDTQTIFLKTNIARDKAEVLLSRMEATRDLQPKGDDRQETRLQRQMMDQAIESMRRTILRLNQAMALASVDYRDEAIDLLNRVINELNESPSPDDFLA